MRAARKKSLFVEEDEREKEVKLNVNESYAKRFEVGCPPPATAGRPPDALSLT